MFQRIIRSPIAFFDRTPIGKDSSVEKRLSSILVGRILNRFTRDVSLMDTELAANVPDFFYVNIMKSKSKL